MSFFLDFFAPHATEFWEMIVPACGWGPAGEMDAPNKRAAKRPRDFFTGTPRRNGRSELRQVYRNIYNATS
jgi:hypothetical protein